VNTFVLAIKWVGEPEEVIIAIAWLNGFFTVFFTLEALVKILGHGRFYFRERWNIFDFSIALMSGTFAVFEFSVGLKMPSSLQVVRALRVSRVLKLFRNMKMLQLIVTTFFQTLPALFNIGSLMFLFIFIYSIIGVNLFATVKMNEPMTEYLNFQTVFTSFLTLIRLSTGESWTDLLNCLSLEYSLTNQCIVNPGYDDYASNGY
jgi:hypothetical protein